MLVDLRSDTITRPTAAMRRAMADADVGDDVLEEDPTVIRLEEEGAVMLGQEASLFVPSGTMANQISIRCLTEPGDEVVLEAGAHPFHYEAGGAGVISGVTLRLVQGVDGHLTPDRLRAAVRPYNVHHAPPTLLSIENTANRGGGRVLDVAGTRSLIKTGRSLGMRLHLDGARIWNAAAALGCSEAELAGDFDLVSACFSKGLGAPVGSLVAGSRPLIHKARRIRKLLGGGMRQVGIIAAGALFAMRHHRSRLAEDHHRAMVLWEGLRECGWAAERPQSNMVYVETPDAAGVVERLAAAGLRCFALAPDRIRLVTHLDVDDAGIRRSIDIFRDLRR